MPHLDEWTGKLVRLPQLFRSKPHNSLNNLDAYDGLGMGELFPEPVTLPEVRLRRRWTLPRVKSEDLVFQSLYEPIEPHFRSHYHERPRRIHTVYARRITPDGTRDRPRLVYIHGYMQPETVIEELALVTSIACALKVEIVHLQPPYHGRRKPRSSAYDGELYWTADVVRSFEALRQTLFDARTLLSLMEAERAGPVGISGLSLGGSLAAILTCLEPRFDFSAPIIAHMDMGALLKDAPVLEAMRRDLHRFGWTHEDFGRFFTRLGWDELRPVVSADRIMLIAARHDRFFDPRIVEEMWRKWGETEIHWYPTSHMGFLPHALDAGGHLRRFVDRLYPRG